MGTALRTPLSCCSQELLFVLQGRAQPAPGSPRGDSMNSYAAAARLPERHFLAWFAVTLPGSPTLRLPVCQLATLQRD